MLNLHKGREDEETACRGWIFIARAARIPSRVVQFIIHILDRQAVDNLRESGWSRVHIYSGQVIRLPFPRPWMNNKNITKQRKEKKKCLDISDQKDIHMCVCTYVYTYVYMYVRSIHVHIYVYAWMNISSLKKNNSNNSAGHFCKWKICGFSPHIEFSNQKYDITEMKWNMISSHISSLG